MKRALLWSALWLLLLSAALVVLAVMAAFDRSWSDALTLFVLAVLCVVAHLLCLVVAERER